MGYQCSQCYIQVNTNTYSTASVIHSLCVISFSQKQKPHRNTHLMFETITKFISVINSWIWCFWSCYLWWCFPTDTRNLQFKSDQKRLSNQNRSFQILKLHNHLLSTLISTFQQSITVRAPKRHPRTKFPSF